MNEIALIERITRALAFMLRHQPDQFDLELDAHGYAEVGEVVRALNERLGEPVSEEDLQEAVVAGDRQRYEIVRERIRALYGHSIPVEPGDPSEPPEILYVAIPERDVERAQRFGLRGGRRRFLHLATSEEDARESGRRGAREYTVLSVNALDAWEEGVNFYDRKSLWLAEEIPTHLLEVGETYDDGTEVESRGRGGPSGERDRERERGRGRRGRRGGRGRDRGDRDRGDRTRWGGSSGRAESPDRGDRLERVERPERAERPDRGERTDPKERPERVEVTDRGERSDRGDRPERSERADRGERSNRGEGSDRGGRTDRGERQDRGGRSDRSGQGGDRGRVRHEGDRDRGRREGGGRPREDRPTDRSGALPGAPSTREPGRSAQPAAASGPNFGAGLDGAARATARPDPEPKREPEPVRKPELRPETKPKSPEPSGPAFGAGL